MRLAISSYLLFLPSMALAQPVVLPLPIPVGMDRATFVLVTEDGSRVVGNVFDGNELYVARWEFSTGWSASQFPDKNAWSLGGMSDGGDVVALNRRVDRTAFIWDANTGLQALDSGDGISTSYVSGDGSVVLGYSFGDLACRWVEGNFEEIGPTGTTWVPHVCTDDGNLIFGHDYFPGFVGNLYDVSSGTTQYPPGTTLEYDAYIYDINTDGTLGVGFALEDPIITQDSGDGFNDLALPCKYQDGEYTTMAVAPDLFYQYLVNVMTEDGSLVFGYANRTGTIDEQVALVWEENQTPESLGNFLEAEGANVDGWAFETVTDVSDDGRFIVGVGQFGGKPAVFRIDRFADQICPADFTGDGLLNFFDVSAYLVAFLGQDMVADLTGDGMLNFFDVSAFLVQFNAGCP